MITWPARAAGQTPDVTGRPDEPWWTRQAVTWMDRHLTGDMSVLEWGAGASTPWLAARCGRLMSIDNNPVYAKMAATALREAGMDPERYSVTVRPLNASYCDVQGSFDAAIVDGRLRVMCCERAARLLVPGGILLLDNAERARYAPAREMLFGWPVIETDNGIWRTNIWIKPNA